MKEIKEHVGSIDEKVFITLSDKVTGIILKDKYKYPPKIKTTYNEFVNLEKEYQAIDTLLNSVNELNIDESVRSNLISGLRTKIEDYKRDHHVQTFKEFVESFNLEKLEREFYEETVGLLIKRTGKFINRCSQYPTLEGLMNYYDYLFKKAKKINPEAMKGQELQIFDREAKQFVKKKVFKYLISLPSIFIEADTITPVPGQGRKLQNRYSITIESFYQKGHIDIIMTSYFNQENLTVMKKDT